MKKASRKTGTFCLFYRAVPRKLVGTKTAWGKKAKALAARLDSKGRVVAT